MANQPYPPNSGYAYPSNIPVNTAVAVQPVPKHVAKTLALREINRVIPSQKGGALGSILFRPTNIRFATQNKGERVYVLVRRHWSKNLRWVINTIMYVALPFVVMLILQVFNVDIAFLPLKVKFVGVMAYLSLVMSYCFFEFFDWYYDIYVVTNERIIDFQYKPFTSFGVKEASLENIENVRQDSIGFLSSLFNYGDVIVETASKKGELLFKAIPSPTKVRDIISDLSIIAKKFGYGH